jgi:hypothetical protein
MPVDDGGAAVRPDQRRQDVDDGRLACAVRPEQGEDGPCRDGQVDAVEHRLLTV